MGEFKIEFIKYIECFFYHEVCYKCERPDTKYRCITCGNAVCNICSVSCSEDTPGYSEEYHCTLENEKWTSRILMTGQI